MQSKIKQRETGLVFNQNTLMIVTIVVLAAILYAGNALTFNTSKIVDLVCLFTFPFMNPTGLLACVAFLVPLNSGITTLYIFGIAAAMVLLREKGLSLRVIFSVVAVAGHELLLNGIAGKVNFMTYFTYLIVVFLFIYGMNKEGIHYQSVCYAFIFGSAMLLLAIFTTTLQNYPLEDLLNGTVRLGVYNDRGSLGGKVAVLSDNANNLGYYSSVATVLCVLLMKDAKFLGRILLSLGLFVNVVLGAFTVSRTWILLVVVGTILSVLFRYRGRARVIMICVLVILFAVFAFILLSKTDIFSAFSDRMDELNEDPRGRIFRRYMEAMFSRPLRLLIGTGALTFKQALGISGSMHNGLQQIFVAYGVPGFVFWLWLMLSPIFRFFKGRKLELYRLVPALIAIVFTQTIQFLNPFLLMMPYMVAICYMKIPDKEELQ